MTLLITTKYTTKSSKTTSGKTVSNKKAHSMSGFYNAAKNLCDELMHYHFAECL
ncbi:hypothetical protein N0P59_000789 [Acinetobacter baumannii]|nr:hypothetical protein [Acinetobacter baumannii]EKW4596741.1 hypothetical protein [Acinetobacter baumannii]